MNTRKVKFSGLSIKSKVQYIFTVFVAIAILLCFVFFVSITRLKLTGTYVDKNEDKLNSVQKSYLSVMENVNNISKLIMINDSVLSYLREDGALPNNESEVRRISDDAVRSELYSILNSFSGSYTVFILKQREVPSNNIMRTDSKPQPEKNITEKNLRTFYVNTAIGIMKPVGDVLFGDEWYGMVSKEKGGYKVVPNNRGAFIFNTQMEIVSFTRIINDIDTQQPIGLLVINIPVRELEETYENFVSDDNMFAYVDSDGKIICSGMEQEQLDSVIKENRELIRSEEFYKVHKNNIISSRKISDTGIYVICSSHMSFLEDMSAEMLGILFGMLVIVLIMVLLISKYINKYVTYPISRLSDTMQISGGGTPVRLDDITSDDEIGRLQECYNDMINKINRLLEEVVDQEKQRQRAEMIVVQEQMKPHFLYNTLDTIGCMALQNTREEVYDAVETLGSFYRRFLSKGNESITLSDELSIVKSYIKLLRLRYDDMFEDFYEVEEELNSMMIIKLILQPFVENSIYHGIRPKGEHGIIRISAYSENNRVNIKIYDSGIGMSREKIGLLLRGEDTKSFGFKGTIERIKNFYQNDVYININSVEGEFCEIHINIPYQR